MVDDDLNSQPQSFDVAIMGQVVPGEMLAAGLLKQAARVQAAASQGA
jgi:hypothetical protein